MNTKNNLTIINGINNEMYNETNNTLINATAFDTNPENTTQLLKKKTKNLNPIHFNYIEYFTTIKSIIHEYKLTELREIVKYIKIKGVKTKQECITKIDEYFVKYINTIKIQRIYRGFLVRHFFNIKGGKGVDNIINKCVNETDFYTLEPLLEIPFEYLFIVKEISFPIKKQNLQLINQDPESTIENMDNFDDKNIVVPTCFYYGFNINSLITLYRKTSIIQNPYNRKKFTIETVKNIFKHYQLQTILFKKTNFNNNIIDSIVPFKVPNNLQINRLFTPTITLPANSPPLIQFLRTRSFDNTQEPNIENLNNVYVSIYPNTNNEELNTVRTSINIFKQQPLNVRINELFIYIDQLGNYTDSAWFLQLNKRKYYIFYLQLQELWTFRAQIPVFIKNNICPLGDPFSNSSSIFRKPYVQITEEEVCIGCLDVIENIIMTSLDVEYRKIGCLHVLTALTYVSQEARNQYGFLVN